MWGWDSEQQGSRGWVHRGSVSTCTGQELLFGVPAGGKGPSGWRRGVPLLFRPGGSLQSRLAVGGV